jgi:hypothetical protein
MSTETNMPNFEVDDDLAELIWRLAKPKPFEQLTFSTALRRILQEGSAASTPHEMLGTQDSTVLSYGIHPAVRWHKKAPSPDAAEWAASVPELRGYANLSTWQSICDVLRIEVAGDSARRKLRNWVKANRPSWPAVPDIESDA